MQNDSTVSNFRSPGETGESAGTSNESSAAGVRNSHTEISVVGRDSTSYLPNLGTSKKKAKKTDHIVVPVLTLEMPD